MRKRTTEEKKRNVMYQLRLYKKRSLWIKALKFIQWLNVHRPAGIQQTQIRHIHLRVAHIMRLPYRWDDEDLKRAYVALDTLTKKYYNATGDVFHGGYQDLLVDLLDTLQLYPVTTEERADAMMEVLFNTAVEINAIYGEKRPEVLDPMLMALALGKPPYPKWAVNEMADYILRHFRQHESIHICNELYNKLEKIIAAQQVADVFKQVEEDTTDEMVVEAGKGTKGHSLS